jgi:hypothetical protein
MLPGEAIRGTSSFEWLEGQQFVIWRSRDGRTWEDDLELTYRGIA